MSKSPLTNISRKSAERSATTPIPAPIEVPRKRRKDARAALTPGMYAAPRTPGMTPPRTFRYTDGVAQTQTPFVREGGNDFLNCPSRGYSC